MRPTLLPIALLAVAACTPPGYTPAARMIPLATATVPATGAADVQLDVGKTGGVFGPDLTTGDLRVRYGATRALTVDGEAGVIHVDDDTQGYNPSAVTGRVGVTVHHADGDGVRTAAFIGAGGGASYDAGSWISLDAGGVLQGDNRHVRPFLGAAVFTNRPTDAPTLTYGPADMPKTFHLHDTSGASGTVGLELGPDDTAVILGLSLALAVRDDGEDEHFFTAALGFRFRPGT